MGMGWADWATHYVMGYGSDVWPVVLKLDDMVSDADGVKTYREWTDVMASVLDPSSDDDEPMLVHVHPDGSMWADVEEGETWEVVPKGCV